MSESTEAARTALEAAERLIGAARGLLSAGASTVGSSCLWLSQRNVEPVIGISARCFMEDLASSEYTAEVLKRGKARLTRAEDYIAFLRARTTVRATAVDDGPASVLAEVGLRVVGGDR